MSNDLIVFVNITDQSLLLKLPSKYPVCPNTVRTSHALVRPSTDSPLEKWVSREARDRPLSRGKFFLGTFWSYNSFRFAVFGVKKGEQRLSPATPLKLSLAAKYRCFWDNFTRVGNKKLKSKKQKQNKLSNTPHRSAV